MAASSFQRKVKARVPSIAGAVPSLYTNQLLTSTGLPDLDTLLGGGLVLGSVLLLAEDASANFSRLMLKYFLSEGVAHTHSLLVTNSSPDCKLITQSLPSFETGTTATDSSEGQGAENSSGDEKMKIAWRYQGQNTTKETNLNISNVKRTSHSFNLLKTVPKEVLEKCDVTVCDIDASEDDGTWKNSSYLKVIQQLQEKVKSGGFLVEANAETSEPRNVVRVGVQSVGLSLWGELDHQRSHLPKFLYSLRSVMRSCLGVAVVTLPSSLFSSEHFLDSILLLSDYCVSLQSFEGDEKVNEVYKDYHGLLAIHKLPSLGSLAPPAQLIQDPSQLVFKSKRTKFVIEKFHLPPDLSENVSRDSKDSTLKKTNIDF